MTHLLTHKGWFGLCPVYIGSPESEEPLLVPRIPLTDWLMDFSDWAYRMTGRCMEILAPEWEWPGYPIAITGRLAAPRVIETEDGEEPV